MICMTVEIGESALTRRVWIAASSIERAPKVAKAGKAGRRMSLVFPIDSEASFAPGGSGQREAA
jgi:hypothetical protein